MAQLAHLEPDLAFNAGAGLLRPPVLAVPRLGWINRHAGRLPDYRGVAPVWWALYNQERSVAVTYHSMAKEVDGGEVLWEHEEAVDDSDTVARLSERLLDHAVTGLWQAIDVLERGEGRRVDTTSGSIITTCRIAMRPGSFVVEGCGTFDRSDLAGSAIEQ